MPTSIEQDAAKLLTLPEAVTWIENHLEEIACQRNPRRDTLKRACQDGRPESPQHIPDRHQMISQESLPHDGAASLGL